MALKTRGNKRIVSVGSEVLFLLCLTFIALTIRSWYLLVVGCLFWLVIEEKKIFFFVKQLQIFVFLNTVVYMKAKAVASSLW